MTRLCGTQRIMTVNGEFPGPTVEVAEGDALIVRVVNRGSYNVTVHWHGVRQMRTGWSDGPEFVTQCPIRPGNSYTYRFTVAGQEGTLWWHAHSSWLRATVHGALLIRPRAGVPYPFNDGNKPPAREIPIILGSYVCRPLDLFIIVYLYMYIHLCLNIYTRSVINTTAICFIALAIHTNTHSNLYCHLYACMTCKTFDEI